MELHALTAEISIVIPTHNTRDTVRPILCLIDEACQGMRWEAIFVDDDSNDGTADMVRRFAREDERVRCIKRIGRHGKVSAAIEGMLSCSAPYIAVMKPDMGIGSNALPKLVQKLIQGDDQIVLATSAQSEPSGAGVKGLMQRFSKAEKGTPTEMIAVIHDLVEPLARKLETKNDWFYTDNFNKLEDTVRLSQFDVDSL